MEHLDPYLYVTVTGARVTAQIALEYWVEVIAECDRLNCSKILLEHDFKEMISMPEMLEIIGPVTDMLKNVLTFSAGPTKNDTTFQPQFPFVQLPWRGYDYTQQPRF